MVAAGDVEVTAAGPGAEPAIDLTVVLPAYNEVETIDGIYAQVTQVFSACSECFEIIFIDDGSRDGTWDRIAALAAADPRVRAIRHRTNFGKASALANGFAYARGKVIVTSDADMQYDPNDILRLLAKLDEGFDVVSAYKVVRRDPLSKRIPSRFFNFFVRNTTSVQLHDINAGLKVFRRDAAEALIRYGYGELHRYFIILAARAGYSVAEVPVESLYRTSGKSKYGMERYMRGALDFLTVFFLTSYAERPSHLLGRAGVWLSVIGGVLFWVVFIPAVWSGRTSQENVLLVPAELLIVTGVQLLVAGLLAEMINNLERPRSGELKIAQVAGIERRTASAYGPGIRVERRRGDATCAGEDAP